MRYAVIGNSTAGVAAAETLRRLDQDGEIVIISADEHPYSRSLTPYLLSGRLKEDQLRFKPKGFYDELKIGAKLGRAVSIDTSASQAILASGEAVPFDRLLIATGASPVIPNIQGISSRGVFCLRSAADAAAIAAVAKDGSRAVVIGGGLIGLLSAKALCELGVSVTVVEALPHILPQQLDPAAAQIVGEVFTEQGIGLIFGRQVSEILSDGGQVTGVHLSDGQRIEARFVVVGVGVRPDLSLAKASGITTERGILVDAQMQTSSPQVYAAGDVAEVKDILTGQRVVSGTWIAATEQGKIAAYNMAGLKRSYEGALPIQNAADYFGLPIISVGLINPPDDSFETLLLRRPQNRLYKKLVLKDDAVKGMIFVGDINRAGVIAGLIRSGTCVTEFKDDLLSGNYSRILAEQFASRQQAELSSYV